MHELAICQALIEQIQSVAAEQCLESVARIVIRIGPLSGAEPELIARAFPLVAAGTVAANASLELQPSPVRIRCLDCSNEMQTTPNHLLCGNCGSWRTQVTQGDELLLDRLEFNPLTYNYPGDQIRCVRPAAVL